MRGRISPSRGTAGRFGFADEDLAPLVGAVGSREQLIGNCDVLVIPKPTPADLLELPEGKVLRGGCIAQDETITQLAIDRRPTLIAWEEMHHWSRDGSFDLHVFHRNNEPGTAPSSTPCSSRERPGSTPRAASRGDRLRGHGTGIVTALEAMGIADVSVLTKREAAVAASIHSMRIVTYERDPDSLGQTLELDSEHESVAEFLADHDVSRQLHAPGHRRAADLRDQRGAGAVPPRNPVRRRLRRMTAWASSGHDPRPSATRCSPSATGCVAAVDHSPSLLWDSATWEISQALIPHLPAAPAGTGGLGLIQRSATRSRSATRDPEPKNPLVLQGRSAEFPHAKA